MNDMNKTFVLFFLFNTICVGLTAAFAIGSVWLVAGILYLPLLGGFILHHFPRLDDWIRCHGGVLLTCGLLIFLMNTEDTDTISYLALVGAFMPALIHMCVKSFAKKDEALRERRDEIQESKNEIETLYHKLSEDNDEHERIVQKMKNEIIDLESEIEILEYKLKEEESLG